jgi:hypothetical protein
MRRITLLILLLATPALATDYYVRTDGDDANTGLANTSVGAWLTPGKCAALTGGNRCRIQPGEYYITSTITQANSGTLKGNDVETCTCTKGSTVITCTDTVSGVAAGDWVRCDATGSYFNWARVSSVVGTTINLDSAYLGDGGYLGESSFGTAFLDVASMVEVVGDGSPGTVIISRTQTQPGGVTWTQSGTYPEVWSYLKSTGTGAWTAPKGFRQTSASWDKWYKNRDGEDTWIKVSVGACPCSSQPSCEAHVSRVQGSWCDDGTRIWAQNFGGTNIQTAGARASNAGMFTTAWTAIKDYTVFRNLVFDIAGESNGYNTDVTYGLQFGGSNSMVKDTTVKGAACNFDLTAARTRLEYRNLQCLDKGTSVAPANVAHSGLRFYNLEVRGGYSNIFRIGVVRGTSPSDRVMFDRMYLHRGFTWYRTTECAGDPVYDCTAEAFPGDNAWVAGHGMEHGSSTDNNGMNYAVIQNSIMEISSDGMNYFNTGGDVIYRNNTFGASYSVHGNARQEIAEFGVNGQASGVSFYNNIWYVDAVTDADPAYYNGAIWNFGNTWSNYIGNNNLHLSPYNGTRNAASSGILFNGMNSLTDLSMATMISTYSQESNSMIVCYSNCSAGGGVKYFNDGADSRSYFIKPSVSDGTVSNYTPVKGVSRAINAGLNAQCPTEDFYGNPRSDGQCDIGAVELQGGVEPAGPHRTDIRPGTKLR